MNYSVFFKKLKEGDPRIEYTEVCNRSKCEGLKLPWFYEIIDPIKVEFEFNNGIVRLEPFAGLLLLNKQYEYVKADCVFATCNGDPIYVKNEKVYTCIHGSKCVAEEEIAVSIDSFFELVYHTL